MNQRLKAGFLFVNNNSAFLAGLLMISVFVPAAAPATANSEVDIEWPCIQGYVPEVALAVVWPEPVEEDQLGRWLKNKDLKKVVNELGDLEELNDAGRDRIQAFAESIPENQRIDVYNQVADGVVYRFNQRRADYFKGIRKYTRQQIAFSEQVESHLNELAALEGKSDADSLQSCLLYTSPSPRDS